MSGKAKTVTGYAILAMIGAAIGFVAGAWFESQGLSSHGLNATDPDLAPMLAKMGLLWAAVLGCLFPAATLGLKLVFRR